MNGWGHGPCGQTDLGLNINSVSPFSQHRVSLNWVQGQTHTPSRNLLVSYRIKPRLVFFTQCSYTFLYLHAEIYLDCFLGYMAFHSMAMFTIATSQEWMSMCLWFLLWKNNTVVNILLWISVHEYRWRKIPRKWLAANAFIILMLSNWPLKVLPLMYPPTGWCTHPMMPKEASFWRWNNGHEGERTNNVLYYSLTL